MLLFSPNARNRTAPLILCGEEEVEGQHAASVGRLDENKLYYLRSRGLSEAQARRLMVDARFAPAIDKIPLEALQDEVRENVAGRLERCTLDGWISPFWLPTKTASALSIWTAPPPPSTPPQVLNAVVNYYNKENANPHRGVYELAMRATDAHEGARHTGGAVL